MTKLRAAIYNRVSTRGQHDPRTGLTALRTYARRIGATVVMTRTDVHTGRSDGPGWIEIIAAARRGEINTVIVPRLDRIGRRVMHMYSTLQLLHDAGARVDVVANALTLKPGGDLMSTAILSGLALAAELEHHHILERTHEGLAIARRRGRIGGRPRVALPDVAAANQLAAHGIAEDAIARELGCSAWSARRASHTCINCGDTAVRWRACSRCGRQICRCGHHREATTPLAHEDDGQLSCGR